MSDVSSIANALSRPQRELLCNIASPITSATYFSARSDERVLIDAGLIIESDDDGAVPEITRLGLDVPLGDFYQRAGIHRSTWARFRDGKFELRADTARRISAALKVIRAEKSGKPSSGGSDPSDSGDVECAPMERA